MDVHHFNSAEDVAEAAAIMTITALTGAITTHGHATWVVAGGSTPLLAYDHIAAHFLDRVDWSRVTIIMGDERIGPLDGPDNNWHTITPRLFDHIPQATFLRPQSDMSAETAAAGYEKTLTELPQTTGVPRFDIVWLGMGEDGHTLSLFPGHTDFEPSDTRLVVPIHHSPKPPADRISLTLHALTGAVKTCILATGQAKATAFVAAQEPSSTLPITEAARLTHATWLTNIEGNI